MTHRPRAGFALAALLVPLSIAAWPSVAGRLLAADGTIDALFLRLALACLSVGGMVGAAVAAWEAFRGTRPLPTTLRTVVAGSAGVLCTVVTIGLISWRREQVDLVDMVTAGRPDAPHGRTEADVAVLLARTARPPAVPPYEAWLRPSAERIETLRRVALDGEIGLLAEPPARLRWVPGQKLDWGRLPPSLAFQLERQTFVLEALAALPEERRAVLRFGLGLAKEWRRTHRNWPDFSTFGWNDDAESHRVQAFVEVMKGLLAIGELPTDEHVALLKSIVHHAQHLADETEHNPDTNHGLSQDAALLLLATEFPQLDANGDWRRLAVARAENYVLEHVAKDGASLELAPGYHLYIASILTWFHEQARRNLITLSPEFGARLRRMMSITCELLQPDGSLPRISDTPGTADLALQWPWSGLPPWPELGALRECVRRHEEAPPNAPGVTVSEAGYVVLRMPVTGWTVSGALHATMMSGPVSHAHLHPNKLAITLFAKGSPLLSGPGYPSYLDPEREALIGTSNQNTVVVDDRNQDYVPSTILFAKTEPSHGVLCGAMNPVSEVRHVRCLLYGAKDGELLVLDELTSHVTHKYRLTFRAASEVKVVGGQDIVQLEKDAIPLARIDTRAATSGLGYVRGELDGRGVAYTLEGKTARYVTRLTVVGTAPETRVASSDNQLTWDGLRGGFKVALPVKESTDCVFVPAAKTSP